MRRGRWCLAAAAAVALLVNAGCGEQTSVTVYKQGKYQGKPDKQPWDNAQFKSDRAAWDKAITARNAAQNEYARVSGK